MDPHIRAQTFIPCDLCKTEQVKIHCDTCHIKLCNACIGEHMASDESKKKHEIVRFMYRKSMPLYPLCTSHEKERCEMYCNPCDIPVCITCITSEQHSGHKMLKILQLLEERIKKIIKVRNELNDTIFPTYRDFSTDIQSAIKQLEKEYGDISTVIAKHGDDWHREIDEVVKKLTAELDEMKTRQILVIQKHLDEINKNISEMRDEINFADVNIDSQNISKLLSITLNVDKYRKLPKKIVPFLPKFIPGKIQGEELRSLFGTMSSGKLVSSNHGYNVKTTQKPPEAESSLSVKHLLDEPKIITIINTEYGSDLITVACLSDDEIWTRGNESIMKLFSINQGSLLKSISTKSGTSPYDIAVTKHGYLVYTDLSDKTVNIVKNEEIESIITLKNWEPCNICSTSSGDLLVVMESDECKQSKVVRFSGSTEKQTIQFDDNDRPLYSTGNTKYISENKNLDICVAECDAKAVVVVNQAGKLRFRYTGHTSALMNQSFCPRGITTDSQSHILTADFGNECVHITDQDGQFLCFIDCRLSYPCGLCTDSNDNLFVAQWINRQVKKVKFLQ